MINMSKAFVEHDDIKPLISEYQVGSSGEDVAAQIAQTENMISAGADDHSERDFPDWTQPDN